MTTVIPIDIKDDPKVEKAISEIVGTLTDPILCWPGYEDMKPPEEIKTTITIQRLIENMAAFKENRDLLGTDAECCWYLSTASLVAPMSHEWCRVYQYCFTQMRTFLKQDVPADLRVDTLTNYEMSEFLLPLKHWIAKTRSESRLGRERAERREQREEVKKEKEQAREKDLDLQPAMFEF